MIDSSARLNAMQTKNNMEVQDICARTHRYVDRTKRVTDPNNPSYVVNGMEIRDDPLSKPKPLPKQLPNFLLQTKVCRSLPLFLSLCLVRCQLLLHRADFAL